MTYSCHVPLVISLESEVGKSDASVYFATYCLLLFFVCFPFYALCYSRVIISILM